MIFSFAVKSPNERTVHFAVVILSVGGVHLPGKIGIKMIVPLSRRVALDNGRLMYIHISSWTQTNHNQ
jgi:hypothetical protein